MWQIFSSISILFATAEEVIDKAAMVGSKTIDLLSATWIRNTIAFVISIVVAVILSHGFPVIFISFPIVILGIMYGISGITYTILLKQVEITASSIMQSFVPLIFLPIDLFIFNSHLLPRQIIGIVVLVIGGLIFFYRKGTDTAPITKKQMFTLISIFLFDTLLIGLDSYLFKDYFANSNLSEADFLVNVTGIMFIFLTIILIAQAIYKRKLPKIHLQKKYIQGSFFSKMADYGNSFFNLKALTLASVSQTTAFGVFYPVALLLVVITTQKKLKINLEEYLDRKTLIPKICGVIIVCFGAFFAR